MGKYRVESGQSTRWDRFCINGIVDTNAPLAKLEISWCAVCCVLCYMLFNKLIVLKYLYTYYALNRSGKVINYSNNILEHSASGKRRNFTTFKIDCKCRLSTRRILTCACLSTASLKWNNILVQIHTWHYGTNTAKYIFIFLFN